MIASSRAPPGTSTSRVCVFVYLGPASRVGSPPRKISPRHSYSLLLVFRAGEEPHVRTNLSRARDRNETAEMCMYDVRAVCARDCPIYSNVSRRIKSRIDKTRDATNSAECSTLIEFNIRARARARPVKKLPKKCLPT